MDLESSSASKPHKPILAVPAAPRRNSRRRRNICLVSLAAVLLLAIIILILILTVFKSRRPVIAVTSVRLEDISVSFDAARLRVLFNVTIDADVSVKNPNRMGMKFKSSLAYLKYRGQDVGEALIPAGEIGGRETMRMNVSMAIMADRLVGDSGMYSDAMAGAVPMNVFTKISGKVNVVGIKVHVVSSASCDFTIFVGNRTVGDPQCKYKTKL